jgi:hypothetical protein
MQEIEHVIAGKRRIRTKSTVFSFHISETRGALSSDFIHTLKRFKPILDHAARKWKLARLIRVLVSDTIWTDTTYYGAKLTASDAGKPYFDIHINLENLHEAEQQFCETGDFMIQGILMLFLHECAHFVTEEEERADSLVKEVISDYFRTHRKRWT